MQTLDFPHTNPTLKTSTAIIGGAAMTFAAFAFMQYLISGEQRATNLNTKDIVVEIFQVPEDTKVQQKQTLPPPPKMQTPPKVPPRNPPSTDTNVITTAITPNISIDKIGGDIKTHLQQPTGEATPIVRINPKYPTIAAREGIEGWVQLSFNISPSGEVIDAQVTDSEPKRIFDREALRAIKRWKYRPKVIDGIAQLQTGQSVQLDFKLDQNQ
ncbi:MULTISPECIES: energy transducer TonB [unclassified Pseudoalteromonas]|uniref:energy transducer TonB n=1 Tax=unclassified Pseudoalteromonas TaxID=194690 RepID=UPI0025B54F0A|nr:MULTISPECIES: energy transducer TonB [unclassified Pseudoalteromonas]MDN3379279.1 energy transducer TonB [Pseudoalteromonas sp. APC 3893]MDN3386453.1 energy transducer TonB [Pseudoalteromonas sp. APC 4017]